ncbi:MAG: hypothetical protein AB2992_05370 [Candidatus Symbiodolus clandestinus]
MNQEQLRNCDKEFKLDAVKLYHSSGKTGCQLGKENLKVSEAENIQLRKELAAVREERDILKNRLKDDLATIF